VRVPALATLILLGVGACESRDDTARVGQTADTVVTSHQMQDTTIVVRDTTVEVDTVKKEGDRPVTSDTVKRSGGSDSVPQ
jgi:hypothetical protein